MAAMTEYIAKFSPGTRLMPYNFNEVFGQFDSNGHVIRVKLCNDDGTPMDASGYTSAIALCIRNYGSGRETTVQKACNIYTADGYKWVSCFMPASFYGVEGRFQIVIKIGTADAASTDENVSTNRVTVFWGCGFIRRTRGSTITASTEETLNIDNILLRLSSAQGLIKEIEELKADYEDMVDEQDDKIDANIELTKKVVTIEPVLVPVVNTMSETTIGQYGTEKGTKGYYDGSGVWRASENYQTFVFSANDYEKLIRFSDTGSGTSLQVSIFNGTPAKSTWVSRTNVTNSNNPTLLNPIKVNSGYVYAVTLTLSTNPVFTMTETHYNQTGTTPVITTFMKNSIKDVISDTDVKRQTIAFDGTVFTIRMGAARYIFKHIDNSAKDINVWRIYSGDILHGTSVFNMWTDSDCEGVMRLAGETDFIGGYHGSEVLTACRMFIDGAEINLNTTFTEKVFRTFAVYEDSSLHHCWKDGISSEVVFTRHKSVRFENGKVTVGNEFKAVRDLSVSSCKLGMFQCYTSENMGKSGDYELTSYEVNTDHKLYDVTSYSASNVPSASARMNRVDMNTKYGHVWFSLSDTDNSIYSGYITQYHSADSDGNERVNRVKAYFDTLPMKSDGYAVHAGDLFYGVAEFGVE